MDGIPREELIRSLQNLLLQRAKLEGAIEIVQNQLRSLDEKKEEDK